MSNIDKINAAKLVITELKKNNYEAFIVGGAVRDYILHHDINDIDIATSANPREVTRIFSNTKPTGIKYGTVTVEMSNEKIEVTTFRTDGEYLDNRHPEQVVFGDNAYDDVTRRDFTINGLLMDEDLRIHDYVGGEKDIENKYIKAIGEPNKRFKEDALRILRAVYFQSKLGFQIEKETRNSMEALKGDILKISRERVFAELIKILKGKHVKRAFKTLQTTGIVDCLPGLSKGINYFAESVETPFVDVFFTASFALNGSVPDYYPFSNKHRHMYKTASELANSALDFNSDKLYRYGVELCLLANKANYALGRSKLLKNRIIDTYDKLPIKSELDLALKANEIITLSNKKAGAWLKECQNELVELVINKKIKNDKESLTGYLKEKGIIKDGVWCLFGWLWFNNSHYKKRSW